MQTLVVVDIDDDKEPSRKRSIETHLSLLDVA
jgi:hypothetical protein